MGTLWRLEVASCYLLIEEFVVLLTGSVHEHSSQPSHIMRQFGPFRRCVRLTSASSVYLGVALERW